MVFPALSVAPRRVRSYCRRAVHGGGPGGAADTPAELVAWAPRDYDEADTAAEVDAAFRAQRRTAIIGFVVFATITFGAVGLTLAGGWWTDLDVADGLSPAFLAAGAGAYLVFLAVGALVARRANRIERSMLGVVPPSEIDPS